MVSLFFLSPRPPPTLRAPLTPLTNHLFSLFIDRWFDSPDSVSTSAQKPKRGTLEGCTCGCTCELPEMGLGECSHQHQRERNPGCVPNHILLFVHFNAAHLHCGVFNLSMANHHHQIRRLQEVTFVCFRRLFLYSYFLTAKGKQTLKMDERWESIRQKPSVHPEVWLKRAHHSKELVSLWILTLACTLIPLHLFR